jgi:hypothetical protein
MASSIKNRFSKVSSESLLSKSESLVMTSVPKKLNEKQEESEKYSNLDQSINSNERDSIYEEIGSFENKNILQNEREKLGDPKSIESSVQHDENKEQENVQDVNRISTSSPLKATNERTSTNFEITKISIKRESENNNKESDENETENNSREEDSNNVNSKLKNNEMDSHMDDQSFKVDDDSTVTNNQPWHKNDRRISIAYGLNPKPKFQHQPKRKSVKFDKHKVRF